MSGKILSGPAALLVVILFFLPWIIVSCNGVQVGEFSGYELATGETAGGTAEASIPADFSGQPLLYIVPFVGIASVILTAVALRKKSFSGSTGWGHVILSLTGFLALLLEWLRLQSDREATYDVIMQPGLWGTLLALAFVGFGGLLDLILDRRRAGWTTVGQRDAMFPFDDSHTILDDALIGSGAGDSATILDDALIGGPGAANYTVLDEDLSGASGGERTILDDELLPGEEYDGRTILDDDLDGAGAYGNVTILDEELAPNQSPSASVSGTGDESGGIAGEVVWDDTQDPTVVSKQFSQSPSREAEPVHPSAAQDKTEVLQGDDVLAWLVITSGERKGEQFRLFANTTIGRDLSNDIVLDDTALSGNHARIKVEDGRYFLFDRKSTNGIFVFNDETQKWDKKDAFELQHGSKIKLGRIVLQLVTA